MEMSAWDEALAALTNELVDQLLAAERHAAPRDSLLPVVQNVRRFVEETATRRAASRTLATTIQLVLNPCVREYYPPDETDATMEELLELFCELQITLLRSNAAAGLVDHLLGSSVALQALSDKVSLPLCV